MKPSVISAGKHNEWQARENIKPVASVGKHIDGCPTLSLLSTIPLTILSNCFKNCSLFVGEDMALKMDHHKNIRFLQTLFIFFKCD